MGTEAQIGTNNLYLALVDANTLSAYTLKETTGTDVIGGKFKRVQFMQNVNTAINSSENPIYADDDLYTTLKNEAGATKNITLAQLTLEERAMYGGGTYDKEKRKFVRTKDDERPTLAVVWTSTKVGGGYVVHIQPVNEVMSCRETADFVTKGTASDIVPVILQVSQKARLFDNQGGADDILIDIDTIDELYEILEDMADGLPLPSNP